MSKLVSVDLNRKEYCYAREYYCYRFEESDLISLNDWIKTKFADENKCEAPQLTLEDVAKAFDGEWNDKLDANYKWKTRCYDCETKEYYDSTYEDQLGSITFDYLNDIVWDSWVESGDRDTDEYEDTVDLNYDNE